MKATLLALVIALFTVRPALADRLPEPAIEAATADVKLPTVKLVDAGKGPKRALRFTARKGTKKTLVMTMEMGMTFHLGGSPIAQKIPAIKMALDIVVTDVAPNGDIRYAFKLRQPEIVADSSTTPEVVQTLESTLAGMVGMSGSAVVSNRGFTKDADIRMPASANAQLQQFMDSVKQSIRQMSAPVPEEKVGVGAKWETTSHLGQNGMSFVQVATNELVALKGNLMTLKITLTQSAAPQKITANGVTVDLQSYTGSGGGDTTLDLGALVPKKAAMTMKSDMQMKSGAQQIGMGFDVTMKMTSR